MEILGWLFLGCLTTLILMITQGTLVKKGFLKPSKIDDEFIAVLLTANILIFPITTTMFMLKYLSKIIQVGMEKLSNGN